MRLTGFNEAGTEKVERHFGAFGLGPFLMAGVQDGFNPLALATVVFLLAMLMAFRKGRIVWFLSAGLFLAALGVGLFLIKMNLWAETLDTHRYYMINQLTYLLLAISAIVLGCVHFRDWWVLLRTDDPRRILGKFAALPVGSAERPKFWSLLYCGVSALFLGFYTSLMQSIYPSPPYLQSMINAMYIQGISSEQTGFFIALYAAMVIISMLSLVLLAGIGFFSPAGRSFLERWLSTFKILAAAVFLSVGIGLLYLLNQPFLGG